MVGQGINHVKNNTILTNINVEFILIKSSKFTNFDSIENNISLAMAWIDEKHGYIDISGQWIIKPIFASHYDTGFENGVALVSPVNSSLYGMIDYNGKWILEPKYGWNTSGDVKTHKGHFTLMDKGRWGVVNSKGIWVIKPNYDFILGATANGYAVKLNNKEIFIDLKIKYKKETDKTNEIKKMNKNYTYGNSNLIISKKLGDLLIKTNNCEDFLKQVKKTFPNLK